MPKIIAESAQTNRTFGSFLYNIYPEKKKII